MIEDFKSGALVYNFSYEDAQGNEVQLSDFKGKWVWIDIWFTGCGACQYVAKGKIRPRPQKLLHLF